MVNKKLIVIAKSAPPAFCGMSDYSYQVAKSLSRFYESVEIAVAELPPLVPESTNQFPVKLFSEVLNKVIKSADAYDVLLNYTPASYARSGWPIKLISLLNKVKKANVNNKLFVHFHESWNGGANLKLHHAIRDKFTKSSMHRIGKMADKIAVFTEGQKEKFETLGFKNIHFAPIGSSISPLTEDAGLQSIRKEGYWIVFGLAHTRLWTFEAHLQFLKKMYADGTLRHLITVGPVDDSNAIKEAELIANNLGKEVLMQLGPLPPEEVSGQLLNAQAALIGQNFGNLQKSSSFAALAAHAIPVICEVPEAMTIPPANTIFLPSDVISNAAVLSNKEGYQKRKLLHEWFWATRSWDAIGENMHNWMVNE